MAVVRTTGHKLIGYLDHPRCRSPLPHGKQRVEFEAWFRGGEWFHEDPGPNARYRPKTEKRLVDIDAWDCAGGEILLIVQSYDEDFIKSLPGFTPVTP